MTCVNPSVRNKLSKWDKLLSGADYMGICKWLAAWAFGLLQYVLDHNTGSLQSNKCLIMCRVLVWVWLWMRASSYVCFRWIRCSFPHIMCASGSAPVFHWLPHGPQWSRRGNNQTLTSQSVSPEESYYAVTFNAWETFTVLNICSDLRKWTRTGNIYQIGI